MKEKKEKEERDEWKRKEKEEGKCELLSEDIDFKRKRFHFSGTDKSTTCLISYVCGVSVRSSL